MSKSNLRDALTQSIKNKFKSKLDRYTSEEIKGKLENYLPKSYNALKELYHLKSNENNGKELNLATKFKKYIISKIPTDIANKNDDNDTIEDYPLLNINKKDNEVSFDINNNKIVINDVSLEINSENDMSKEVLKSVINNIDASKELIDVVKVGYEIKTIYDTILGSSELISNEKQNDIELDNKINEILELCLIIIDTCQIAVDSEQQENPELIDNILNLLNDLNNQQKLIIEYIETNVFFTPFKI